MSATTALKIRKPLLSLRSALWLVLLLWLLYTFIYAAQPGNNPLAFLEFIPGVLAVALLLRAGLTPGDCYLQPRPLSGRGALLLGISLLLMPAMWLTGRWVGWDWAGALVYAPASGVSQELFFRASLLPVLLARLPQRSNLATILQALLFSAWHVPRASISAPIGGIIAIALVTFACGILWAKQVQRDRTVFWLMGYHSAILFVNSFFMWG